MLRNRARYEVANNSYAKGICLTLANDVIGIGPRPQMLTPQREATTMEFEQWAADNGLEIESMDEANLAGLKAMFARGWRP